MNRLLITLAAAGVVAGCASQPEVEAPEAVIGHTFQVVPRKPDVAAYPAVSEHVLHVASPFRNMVVIRVTNYPKPKPLPAPVFISVAQPSSAPAPRAPSAAVPVALPKLPPQKAVIPPRDAVWEETIHFPFDVANLSADAKRQIDAFIASVGVAIGDGDIRVEAFADSMGSDSYNQKLTNQRASEVAKYLIQKGASASKVKAVGMGSRNPVASNVTEDGRAQNRRAEVHLSTKE